MSLNVSILTGNVETLVEEAINAYNRTVLGHLYDDFNGHTQVRVHAVPFIEDDSGHVVSSHTLRMQMTHPTLGVIAVALPCEPTATTVTTDGPPVFVGQPEPVTSATAGQNIQFAVYVASTTSVHYQWQKNGGSLSGETSAVLFLESVASADAAIYRCVATNTYGPTVSSNGTLFVS